MGRYLNSSTPYALYQGETNQPYFVDKSLLLAELFPVLDAGNQHICITRPRRFGKTIMANMIAAFLSKKVDSDSIFSRLKITSNLKYKEYRNKYNVISIDFSKISRSCDSYSDYIGKIETTLIRDLKKEYPQIEVYEDDSAADHAGTAVHGNRKHHDGCGEEGRRPSGTARKDSGILHDCWKARQGRWSGK